MRTAPCSPSDLSHPFEETLDRGVRTRRLHDDACDLTPVRFQDFLERIEIVVLEGKRGPLQLARNAARRYSRQQMLLQGGRRPEVGRNVPVVPSVITTEDHLIPARRSPRDADRHHVRFAPTLAEAHHFSARDYLGQQLRRFDLKRMVQRQPCTQRGLILNRFNDTRERVAQEYRSRAHVEIDVLVPIDVPEVAGALAVAVDG